MNAYHIHTPLCRHADGPVRAYVENAVKSGFSTIAFSDHVPQIFEKEGYYSDFRMLPEQTEGYVAELCALRQEFAGQIQIKIGFETEYYPATFAKLMNFLSGFAYDFLFLGQHFTCNEWDEGSFHPAWIGDDREKLHKYVSQATEALETGYFSMFAHPDLPHFEGSEEEYRVEMIPLCEKAKELGIPLEFNLLGLRTNRHYPSEQFFRLAGEVGNTVVLGQDAHEPEVLLDFSWMQKATEILKKLGITPVDKIRLERRLF